MPKRTEMALPVATKLFLQPSPDAAMLFWWTHPPHLCRPFCSKGHCQKWYHEAESLM